MFFPGNLFSILSRSVNDMVEYFFKKIIKNYYKVCENNIEKLNKNIEFGSLLPSTPRRFLRDAI